MPKRVTNWSVVVSKMKVKVWDNFLKTCLFVTKTWELVCIGLKPSNLTFLSLTHRGCWKNEKCFWLTLSYFSPVFELLWATWRWHKLKKKFFVKIGVLVKEVLERSVTNFYSLTRSSCWGFDVQSSKVWNSF